MEKAQRMWDCGKGALSDYWSTIDADTAHSIVAILDLADEALQCEGLVIILEKSSPNLKEVIHSLMYVGGAVVTQPVFPLGPAFVLLGLSI